MLRDALKNHDEKGKKITLFILDEKNRYKGKFEVHNCSARRSLSKFGDAVLCSYDVAV